MQYKRATLAQSSARARPASPHQATKARSLAPAEAERQGVEERADRAGERAIEFAQIEPVGQCNLRCQMCPIQFRPDGPPHGPLAFMAFDTYRRLIDEMPRLKTLHLQGLGEPLMHPQFFEMVRYAVDRGIRVTTNTNLTLLSKRRAKICVESGLHELHASLDAANPATYERIRVRARFGRALRHLEELLRVRTVLGSASPKVRLVMVLMRDNLSELMPMVELAHRLGVETLFVQHLCHEYGEANLPGRYLPMRDFVEQQTLLSATPGVVDAHFVRARARAAELGVDLRLPSMKPKARAPRCTWPWDGPYISYRGEAMPCCMVGTPDRANLGNVLEQGVHKVWNGETYENFRAALASDNPPDVCRTCSLYRGVF